MGIPGRRCRTTGAGFTLIELVLTIALILLLVGASVINFSSLQRGVQLDEGVGQLEFLFRLARASASGTGRQVRVSFGGDLGTGVTNGLPAVDGIQVAWEPDPVGAPGQFHPLAEATPLADRLNDLVKCHPPSANPVMGDIGSGPPAAVIPPDGSAAAPSAQDATGSTHPPAVVFYPDGSSDPADLILVSRDPEDLRQVRFRLAGLTGTVRRQWLSPGTEPGDAGEVTGPEDVSRSSGSPSGVRTSTPGAP